MTSRSDIERRGAVSAVSAAGRHLTGYAARFDSETRIGSFREVIRRGAFAGSLDADILALIDHDPSQLLGRTRSGTLRLSEDDNGLVFDLALPDTRAAADLLALAERGDLGGMSFGFVATDEQWHGDLREIRAVNLHEISVIQSWPAYQQTEVNVRHRVPKIMTFGRQWLETCR